MYRTRRVRQAALLKVPLDHFQITNFWDIGREYRNISIIVPM